MIREGAVRLHVQTDQFHIAISQDRGNDEPPHPVPSIYDHFDSSFPSDRHQPVEMRHEICGQVTFLVVTHDFVPDTHRLCAFPQLSGEIGVHGGGAGQTEFHAVVPRRVVTCGELHPG